MAALAALVAAHGLHEPDLLGMAVSAGRLLGERSHEVVRLMALLAVRTTVKILVGSGNLVAAAAALRSRIEPRVGRMGIVASDAGAGDAAARMIGMLVGVALGAGSLGRAAHVVRRVAALAFCVRANSLSAEHVHVFVAAATSHRLRFLELMRAVAAHAFAVPLGKSRRLGHDRALRGVAGRTPAPRLCRRRMLVLMAEATGSARRFSLRGVRSRDVAVTGRARRGLRLVVLVRAVTTQTFVGSVDLDRGYRPLTLGVAALAIASRVSERRFELGSGADRRFVTGTLGRERVASRAIGSCRRAEAFLSLFCGVLDPRLLFMASAAALGCHASDRIAGKLVAFGTRNLLVYDVDLMAAGLARGLPLCGNVNAEPMGSTACTVTVGIRAGRHSGHEERSQEPDWRQLV